MSNPRALLPSAALLFALAGAHPCWAEERPQLVPTRDVDVSYDVTRPHQPKTRQRERWLAGDRLERIDGSGGSTTIFDRNSDEITLLVPANRTYRKLTDAPRRALEPAPGTDLKRGNDAVVAGLHCTEWTWLEDTETHTLCVTADGVMLRLVVDGQTLLEARSVKYVPQKAELFHIPSGYTPALAPDGAAEP